MRRDRLEKLIELDTYPVIDVLDTLLIDRTTKKNIIWATRSYEEFGEQYTDTHQIDKAAILEKPELIQPRVAKSLEAQQARTKAKAEVFTPSWICNKMNNYVDEEWFGRKDVFNVEGDKTWTANNEKITFPEGKKPEDYITENRLEITCGEAPFLVSRYDAATGEIIPVEQRIGLLDRKLRIASEKTNSQKDWLSLARKAFKSIYGYEFQGDNLLIGRINLLMTFVDYWKAKWPETEIKPATLKGIAEIISWNLWQMDGLTDCVPLGVPEELPEQDPSGQISFFDLDEGWREAFKKEEEAPLCVIKNWNTSKNGEPVEFALSKRK